MLEGAGFSNKNRGARVSSVCLLITVLFSMLPYHHFDQIFFPFVSIIYVCAVLHSLIFFIISLVLIIVVLLGEI